MKLCIVAVDLRSPAWSSQACEDYAKRFPRDWKVELRTVREEPRRGQPREKLMAAEAERIRRAVPKNSILIALDERGRDLTTMQFAAELRRWQEEGESPAFIIGGTDGIDAALKKDCRMLIRLSSMTLPHALARVVLFEQLYRAWSILNNHPYHRA
ncbi:23S rRNA (pseudouridine(1915)-N(3))-methyltransferase RlmH [Mesosutterella sp. OilRF-GAM-744-9]|uniref:Ribosomal RNA large subunit methyltransferase H n=1 Tax=Mesosutterella porci TaxID=2915351 RepID=A0ABS9MNZ1_9BURK|nr:23S rRNA (pseudouridine(1915)-N(3))-methyltransferase RlmH [Mesosutterella sp. oilRF-744-WT-GAM-9]MCG5030343.1 23S rRNA (pseudouridine(1915)-N(3))-methyltransferase RlmH [Mesosutterella sp. oilRF-744-WT-GAM-9]MCI6530663.1 23S rRNA (pseudouridine(1915)-N(3))-methyltransferase RlmH [Mesosutterella sp.]